MKLSQNIFGLAICTLFLTLAVPVKADLLFENIEALTNDENWWEVDECVRASGYCITGGIEYYGVSLPM